ncbi:MAG: tRNA (adenosine(37)-N6)-threonylcarbamoyltransferase complex transferase subunit TsaD [Candidatus Daviesbacteria bacterium]|nr:tRNA (adenosine(37)-N6)-threonylcarbamoyltransferase complex transferase subunit TsaD [Candidatus Daviesbacteria bacterium]
MKNPRIILGIESSCDETACAIVASDEKRVTILSNIVASSAELQAKFGGVIPEQAAREQLKSIIPVIQEALTQAKCHPEFISGSTDKMLKQVQHDNKEIIKSIDAIAVTEGPGLIGSLLVGVETAKVLATVWNKPLIPVNHLLGHFYANWISPVIANTSTSLRAERSNLSVNSAKQSAKSINKIAAPGRSIDLPRNDNFTVPTFPAIGLLVSGGHTDLILMTDHGKYKYLGGTRDDAAGECFDKSARLLGLPYPGGPSISKMAEKGNPKAYPLPRPMLENGNFSAKGGPAYGWDFSFSGLKTAISNIARDRFVVNTPRDDKKNNVIAIRQLPEKQSQEISNLSASIQEAITDVLVAKTLKAVQTFKVEQILVAGGVAANQILAKKLVAQSLQKKMNVRISIPTPKLCTDNAVYIATSALYNYHPIEPIKLQANPNISLSD